MIRWLFGHIEEAFAAFLVFLMSTLAFLNVISRYVVHLPLNFVEELNVYLFVWLAFVGSALASRKGSHVVVNLIYKKFPQAPRKILYILIQTISIVLFAAICYCGCMEVLDEIEMGSMTETLVVPVWWFTASIPVGSLLIAIRTLQKMISDLKNGTF